MVNGDFGEVAQPHKKKSSRNKWSLIFRSNTHLVNVSHRESEMMT